MPPRNLLIYNAFWEQKVVDGLIKKEYCSSMKNKLAEIGGWIGMVLIHGATIPTSVAVIMGCSDHLPPLDMILMIWVGLMLFFIRALARFDWLYLVSNGIGFFLQSVLLWIILTA